VRLPPYASHAANNLNAHIRHAGDLIVKIRSAFQRVVLLPIQGQLEFNVVLFFSKFMLVFKFCIFYKLSNSNSGADTLWREYDQYEHGINKALAKEFLAKLQPLHLLAKVVTPP
jgi:hypothetical protein